MKPIEHEFTNLLNLSNTLRITKDYFKLDTDDPIVMDAIAQVEDENTFIIREGYQIHLNDMDLGMSLRIFYDNIDATIDEIKSNLIAIDNEQEKNQYLGKLKKEVEDIETLIEEKDSHYIPQNLYLNNIKITDLESHEIEEISNHFLDRKKKLRLLLNYINSQIMKLKPTEELTNIMLDNKANKRIQLVDEINLLVTLFYDLLEKKYIITSRENLAKFIVNNFVDKNRINLNKSTVDTILKPSKEDKRKTLDKRIIVPDK